MNPRQTSQLGSMVIAVAGAIDGLSVYPSCTARRGVDRLDFMDSKNGEGDLAGNLLFESWEEAVARYSGAAAGTAGTDKEREVPRGVPAAEIPTSSSSLLYGR